MDNQIDLWTNWKNNFHLFELLNWDEESRTTFYIVNLKTGEVQSAYTDPFFSVHQINSYEEEGNIILDLCQVSHNNMADYQRMKNFRNPPEEPQGLSVVSILINICYKALHDILKSLPVARFTINIEKLEVAKSFLGNGFDFPTINEVSQSYILFF